MRTTDVLNAITWGVLRQPIFGVICICVRIANVSGWLIIAACQKGWYRTMSKAMSMGFHDEGAFLDYVRMLHDVFAITEPDDVLTAIEYVCDDKGINDMAKVTVIRTLAKDI
jgi:hypothetical protein